MPIYELVTLTLRSGTVRNPARFAEVQASITAFIGGATLGCFLAEFGPQNRVTMLREFESIEAVFAERQRVLRHAEPFVPAALLTGMNFETFVQFPGLPPIRPGAHGPYYEFRTYVMKTGGLAPTIAAWQGAIPGRAKLSPLITVMHSLDGEPRFVHVWGYRDLAQREAIRAEAFASGVWPAPGAPCWLTENLKTELFTPTAISRLC